LGGGFDEGGEKGFAGGGGHVFGMPLDGEPEGEGGIFDGFDEAVGGESGGDEAVAECGDALAMAGIYGEVFGAEDLVEQGAGADGDGVLRGGIDVGKADAIVVMLKGIFGGGGLREIFGEVLVECAAALDVHFLATEADAEDGEGAGFGEVEDCEVKILAAGMHDLGGGVERLAVEGGVDIGAAGEEESVDGVEHVGEGFEVGRAGGVGEEDREAAGVEDGVDVGGVELAGVPAGGVELVGGGEVESEADAGARHVGGSFLGE